MKNIIILISMLFFISCIKFSTNEEYQKEVNNASIKKIERIGYDKFNHELSVYIIRDKDTGIEYIIVNGAGTAIIKREK